ncbi:hypothetical protein FJQ87_04950 [Shewanella sp. SNU WT4]|uniref:hypothetical protein n=1 Tax=Shewanella sp. SNU WT4 TaxID=2590015 RepID=UPI00112C3D31|nr:hypothetical protein [Shewanella sp. SNU WT4]QDF66116.1 hypothetical protein FJQ87_04950 [Shewanella sp. SNU WT4]
MRIFSVLLAFVAMSANASCLNGEHLGEVEFSINSSYFSGQGQQLLNQVNSPTASKASADGYLLLQFSAGLDTSDEKLKDYNKWLAQRRIERIKHYLTTQAFNAPIISRILTVENTQVRSVQLYWCPALAPDISLAE